MHTLRLSSNLSVQFVISPVPQTMDSTTTATSSSVPTIKSLENCPVQGWLVKQGGQGRLISNWRKRWFILDRERKTLHYFKSQSPEEQPAGSIDLRQFTHIELHGPCKKSAFCWALSSRPVKEMISPPIPLEEPETCAVPMEPVEEASFKNDEELVVIEPVAAVEEEIVLEKTVAPSAKTTAAHVSERVYYAYAQNEEELNYWLKAIRSCLPATEETVETTELEEVPPPPPSLVDAPEEEQPEADVCELDPTTVTNEDEQVACTEVDVNSRQTSSALIPAEDELKRQSITSSGYKVATLPLKMAELDEKMRNLSKLSREELPVVHDLLRMVHALVQKEFQQLGLESKRSSIVSQADPVIASEPAVVAVDEQEVVSLDNTGR